MLRRLAPVVLSSLLLATPASAGPVLLDRVVAIIDDHGIFRSEVITHASHDLADLELRDRSDAKKVDAVLKAALARMIDDIIIAKEAQRLHIVVDDAEVNHALELVAKQNNLTTVALLDVAKKQGMSEAEYRGELRRRILDAKWVQIRVAPRVKDSLSGTEEERNEKHEIMLEAERKKQLAQLRAESFVEVHW